MFGAVAQSPEYLSNGETDDDFSVNEMFARKPAVFSRSKRK